jgi:hypothetical protein
MNLREALIAQGPSLELQRAAADEIARLDAVIKHLATAHYEGQAQLGNVRITLMQAVDLDRRMDEAQVAPTGDDYNNLFGLVQAALNCTEKKST